MEKILDYIIFFAIYFNLYVLHRRIKRSLYHLSVEET